MQRAIRRTRTRAITSVLLTMALSACPKGHESESPDGDGSSAAWTPPPTPAAGADVDAEVTLVGTPVPEPPRLTWRERIFVDAESLKKDDPPLYMRIKTAVPEGDDPDDPAFQAIVTKDPRAAAVLLARIQSTKEPDDVRVALIRQLPFTNGEWSEAAAHLIRYEAEPAVRRELILAMRFAAGEHAVTGLRRALSDEEPELRAAAARIAGFHRGSVALEAELVAHLIGEPDWETRVEVARTLGRLRLSGAFSALVTALDDRDWRVRRESLIALDLIDHDQAVANARVQAAARDRNPQVAAQAKRMLKATAAPRPSATATSATSTTSATSATPR